MKYLIAALFLLVSVSSYSKELFPGNSIYQIQSKWTDHNNNSIQLQSFAGRKTIVGMVYTGCSQACPMTISKIKEIENEISKLKIGDYKIVLASFDVKRDTPAHLKKYTIKRKLNEKWTLLSADKDSTVRELAAVLGVNYKEIDGGDFTHSNVISLLNEQGVVIAKIESLSADIAPIVTGFKDEK